MVSQNQIDARRTIEQLSSRTGRDRIELAQSSFASFHESDFIEFDAPPHGVYKALFFETLLQKDMLKSFAGDERYVDVVVRSIKTVLAQRGYCFEYAFERSLDNIFSVADESDGPELEQLTTRICDLVRPFIKRFFEYEETTKGWRSFLLPVQNRDLQFKYRYAEKDPIQVSDIAPTRLAYYTMLFGVIMGTSTKSVPFRLGQAALGDLIKYAEFLTYARSVNETMSKFLIAGMFDHFSTGSNTSLAEVSKQLYHLEILSRPPERKA